MGQKLPIIRCPLKIMGLNANPGWLSAMLSKGGQFIIETMDQRPDLLKCDRDKCGFYASYSEEYEVDVEADVDGETKKVGTKSETRTVEGCGIALLARQVSDIAGGITESVDGVADVVDSLAGGVERAGAIVLGVAKVASDKFGMSAEFEKIKQVIEDEGEGEPDDDDEEPEGDEPEGDEGEAEADEE